MNKNENKGLRARMMASMVMVVVALLGFAPGCAIPSTRVQEETVVRHRSLCLAHGVQGCQPCGSLQPGQPQVLRQPLPSGTSYAQASFEQVLALSNAAAMQQIDDQQASRHVANLGFQAQVQRRALRAATGGAAELKQEVNTLLGPDPQEQPAQQGQRRPPALPNQK